jgi:hypothetical protein
MSRALAAAVLAAAFAALRAGADDVRLTDGTLLQGRITIETPRKIVLQLADGRRVVDRGDIASIEMKPFAVAPAKGASASGGPDAKPSPGVAFWPPRIGETYPDLALRDASGNVFRLSSLKGKVILLEPIGMTCTGCQAFSGGNLYGGFRGITAQPGIDSLEKYLALSANGLTFDDPNVAYVQVIIYDMTMNAPSTADLKQWADHFKLSNRPHVHVLAGTPEMIGPESFAMIPGIQLIDKNFVLRSVHLGHGGGTDLCGELLPMAGRLASGSN